MLSANCVCVCVCVCACVCVCVSLHGLKFSVMNDFSHSNFTEATYEINVGTSVQMYKCWLILLTDCHTRQPMVS